MTTYTWQDVGDSPSRILSQAEKEVKATKWNANEVAKETAKDARAVAEVARKANVASAKTKLQNLGLTVDEVKDAFNI